MSRCNIVRNWWYNIVGYYIILWEIDDIPHGETGSYIIFVRNCGEIQHSEKLMIYNFVRNWQHNCKKKELNYALNFLANFKTTVKILPWVSGWLTTFPLLSNPSMSLPTLLVLPDSISCLCLKSFNLASPLPLSSSPWVRTPNSVLLPASTLPTTATLYEGRKKCL